MLSEALPVGIDSDAEQVVVAAVQSASAFLDAERTTDKACSLIELAARAGAKIVGFPESYLPGHPGWFHFHSVTALETSELNLRLLRNSVTVPGPQIERVCETARRHRIFVVLGITERIAGETGTMYNTQVHINCAGEIVGKHQKLVPTLGERLVHAPGAPETFGAVKTQSGRVSSLICGENSNPLALFALAAEYPKIHVMSWPPHFNRKVTHPREHIRFISQFFANSAKCFVISSVGLVDESLVDAYDFAEGSPAVDYLRDPVNTGGAMIVGPNGSVMEMASGSQEEVVYATINLADCDRGRITQDYAGHYNRPDIFTLTVNTSAARIVELGAHRLHDPDG